MVDALTGTRLKLLTAVVLISGLVGLAYGLVLSLNLPIGSDLERMAQFVAQGMIVGALFGSFEIFYVHAPAGERIRRLPFSLALLVKTFITAALLIVAFLIGAVLLFTDRFEIPDATEQFVRDIGFAFVISLAFQFVLTIRLVIGGRVLRNIVAGRYHHPLRENRIFLFLDLAGSTAMAEEMGDIGAQSLISRFFFDVAQVTAAYGGETHRYIGDEVVVTWPVEKDGLRNARCVQSCFAIADRLDARRAFYLREFGRMPAYRIGLHGGHVVAAECGDDKREIVYFGDTVNTAARIEQYCKEAGEDLLISRELLGKMVLPDGLVARRVASVQLRGRDGMMDLATVDRATT